MIQSATCTTCGGAVPNSFAQTSRFCPTCLILASRPPSSPDNRVGDPFATHWTDAFPQFELENTLRDDGDLQIWEARDLDRHHRPVVLQVLSGTALEDAGGSSTLLTRANRLRDLSLRGLARILDAGDLSYAFFLVTDREESWTNASAGFDPTSEDELAALLSQAAVTLAAVRNAGLTTGFDLRTAYCDPAGKHLTLTPSIVPPALEDELANLQTAPQVFALAPGVTLDGYHLEEKTGEGGFGEVWRARQEHPKRTVALKILKDGLASPRLLARFEVEQQALARLDHAHIARFFDGDTTPDGRPYFAMEWIEGTSITSFCGTNQSDLAERLRLFREVGEAIQHAHQKGIIHRDLKPSNVLVATDNGSPSVKVIDFGIARALEEPLTDQTLLTRAEEMIGTPVAMSPEQTRGADLDARADVYGLGILLYELLTEELPFDPNLPADELRRRIREDDPARPSQRFSDSQQRRRLAGDLDWIVMRCLEKDPDRRYASVGALLRDLERHSNHEPVEAGPPGLRYLVSKWMRRHTTAVAAGLVVIVTLITATVISSVQASRASAAEGEVSGHLETLQTAYDDLNQARSDSQHLLVNTLIEKGSKDFNEGQSTALFTLQEAVTAAKGAPGLEQKALEFWSLTRSWLPGGVHYVIDEPFALSVSHDEKLIAWCDGTNLNLYRPDNGTLKTARLDPTLPELRPHKLDDHYDTLSLIFSSDNHQIAFHNPEAGRSQVWNVESWTPATDILSAPGEPGKPSKSWWGKHSMVAFSRDGQMLASASTGGQVCLWSIRESKLVTPPWDVNCRRAALRFSNSGDHLVIGRSSTQDSSSLFDGGSTIQIVALHEPGYPVRQAGATEQIDKIVQARSNEWFTMDAVPGRVSRWDPSFKKNGVFDTKLMMEDICLSPNQQSIACGNRWVGARMISSSALADSDISFSQDSGGVRGLGFSRDGTILATGGLDGTVQYWQVDKKGFRLGEWRQPGVIDQLVAPEGGSRFFLTKSRSRDRTHPARAYLRSFPTPASGALCMLPENYTLMDVTGDGSTLLLRGPDELSLHLAKPASNQPKELMAFDPPATKITSARFMNNHESVAWCLGTSDGHRFGIHNLNGSKSMNWGSGLSNSSELKIMGVLPGTPPTLIAAKLQWMFRFYNCDSGRIIHEQPLSNRPISAVVAAPAGWFSLCDQSGTIRRFDLESFDEIGPTIQIGGFVRSMALSGDMKWLLTLEWNKTAKANLLTARYIAGEPPYFPIRNPLPHVGGELHPVGNRSFLYQSGTEVRRINLPEFENHRTKARRLTESAIGLRKDQHGQIQLLSSAEFQAAQEEN